MQHRFVAVSVMLAAVLLSSAAAAQTASRSPEQPAVGSAFSGPLVRDLPLGGTIYSLLETTQSEVIADRFNSGGLNVGGDVRVGGFLGSWSQTLFRVGDIDVSDPSGSGSPLLFLDSSLWDRVVVATGMMPADINAPGLAVSVEPRRAASAWTRTFSGSGSGGGLAAKAPVDQPVPISRLEEFARADGLVSGPIGSRSSILVAGTWRQGTAYRRERLADTTDRNASAFAHVVFAASPEREWRVLGWLQRIDAPHQYWQITNNPAASTEQTSIHVQSTVEHHQTGTAAWRVFGGFTERSRTNDPGSSALRIERIVDGPVANLVEALADQTARRLTLGARLTSPDDPQSRHHLAYGVDLNVASTRTSDSFDGTVFEAVDVLPARIWNYTSLGESSRSTASLSVFASDAFVLSESTTLDLGLRGEIVRGKARDAERAITWGSLLPHAYLRWQFSGQRAFFGGYARSANALSHAWLAFGDPSASVATVASAAAPSVVVSRVGPGTGGNQDFSRIDSGLRRPYTDEFVVGYEKRRSASTRYTLTGIARREANLLGVVNTGVTAAGYTAMAFDDAGKDLVDPSDDRLLTVYSRLPASYGRDAYLLTNPGQEAATAFALRMSWERETERLFLLFGATASAAQGSGGNRGYGPLENDQDVPGELFTNPNAATYARGRLFSDRAFTIKWTTLYRFPRGVTVSGIARYQDGQPFSRLVVVPDLNQGAEPVQAYANAGSRFTFTGTLDLRVQKSFESGPARIDAFVEAYNLLTRSNEVEEYVVSGPDFRTSTAIQPPHSVHFGLRVTF